MKQQIVKKETLKKQVYEYLREEIITGGFAPGERLVEEKIAKQIQVSRSPIREAIRMLEKEGLVTVNKGGGVAVFSPDIENFQYLYECRVVLEPLAAYYAAQRITKNQIEDLRRQLISIDAQPLGLKEILEMNTKFHEGIVEASRNPFLIRMIEQIRGINSLYRIAILKQNMLRMKSAIQEHIQIFEAIKRGDADKARECMEEHIESDYKYYISIYQGRK
ncbi:Transcriptional regulator, GntR [Geobacillus thermoleovorans CCB_US3_UF5]|uniref:GntR family transcriptional regulator n=3 Tax=Geobacillus TaxID=129337 RepID=A0A7U9P658_GEOTM|nr:MULTISPECIES: GntR family transcriptional regulator [Geobacillus]AEV18152.1 Transcriptional regulator, GntR [Geobacillus thermoleovorans CCB_US3_UF5]AMV10022.1 GntR family transcriptional regulator [Geobacillus thermoleovorans]ESU72312.1 GntR family transcriptional regulator [Geobacillus sp. MAS1]OQP18121.1 GntR family transcriptional regulator [Geobacillus zalihae]QDY72432.1 GntR family transcriptional regulator [Geobacillus thermoleovorans]